MTALLWPTAAAAAALGAAHLWARASGHARAARWLKPVPVALALAVVLASGGLLPPPVAPLYRTLVALALLASMAGDIFLALPRERFVGGLASFLLAHLLYIGAFAVRDGLHAAPLALLLGLGYGATMLLLLLPHVEHGLRAPVVLYLLVILTMGWQAAGLWQAVGDRAAALALAGALCFVISDSVLAWEKFRRRFAAAPLLVMSTYYVAQWLLALSVLAWGG